MIMQKVANRSEENQRVVKVNLGSGKSIVSGWINYDVSINIVLLKNASIRRILFRLGFISKEQLSGWPNGVVRTDVRKGIPLPDDSVDYIYCSHMLEHLSKYDGKVVVRECHRVLKQEGCLRVIVPDLKKLAVKYVNNEMSAERFIEMLELVDERSLFKKILFSGRKHHWMYDYESLSHLLYDCGFSSVVLCDFRKGVVPDIKKLDRYPENSLFVEAKK